jgi:hypothetical protein
MRRRTLLAWSLFLATLGCLVGGLVVTLLVTRPLTSDVLVDGAFEGAIWLLFATIGLVLTLRRPANPIGWLYAAAGLVWAAYVPWDPWVDQLLGSGRPLPPAARLAALAGDSLWAVGLTLAITLPLLLLPNGRLRSRRWRVVAVAAVVGTTVEVVGWVLSPTPMTQTPVPVAKPFPLGGWAGTAAGILTYTAVTALLVVPYLLVVPAASRLAAGSGSLAVAAATLAVAALFQPLRRRVQDLVDRRFNRRRYDAARTLDAFAARLRDQVDLDALEGELLGVVDQTMRPTRASLWLRHAP